MLYFCNVFIVANEGQKHGVSLWVFVIINDEMSRMIILGFVPNFYDIQVWSIERLPEHLDRLFRIFDQLSISLQSLW